jgi:hypothetical protein
MQGRSQHKTQGMGTLQLRGAHESSVHLVDSRVPVSRPEHGLFDGIDTSITGLGQVMGLSGDALKPQLEPIQRAADRALAELDPRKPGGIVPVLAEGLRAVRAARTALKSAPGGEGPRADVDFVLAHEERGFEHALAEAAGVVVDALSDAETVTPGGSVVVSVNSYVADASIARIGSADLKAPRGWTVGPAPVQTAHDDSPFARFRREMPDHQEQFRLAVPADAPITQPYWLQLPRDGYIYHWPAGSAKNEPFSPPLVTADVSVEIGGVPVTIHQPVQYRYSDRARGELRRNLNIVPALSVGLDSDLEIVPLTSRGQARRVSVRLTTNAPQAVEGRVELTLPAGWTSSPASAPFTLKNKGEQTAVPFQLTPPPDVKAGQYHVGVVASIDGHSYNQTLETIAYPHIQTHRRYEPAAATVDVLDMKVAPVRVGYIMGSGDEVPAAIRRLGLPVTMLSADDLSVGDLTRFDTIVVGIRASQTRPDFVANTDRLLNYVRQGGTLIVQYQQPDYVQRQLMPFPAEMDSRVTDENAPVKILQPDHPVFTFPNRITASDWDHWVQERDLYSLTTFDPRYVPLLESQDPGEGPQNGGEVYARLGKGQYVYTSYAWFRQLPAGVPGAYRLFANLLSLAKAPATR